MDTATFEKYGLKPLEPLLETEQITMWKMTEPAIHRTVLVHVLGMSMASDPNAVAYLFSVARSISNATAPAIAQVYTIFDEPDLKAVVSEYVDGLSLAQTVSAIGPLSMKQTVRTGIAVAEALKDVWDNSHIIYGSVRPEFITLDAGATAKLISPCYAQVAPAEMEVPASDMSDLGELLYFLSTGVQPGQAHSVTLPKEFSAFLEKLSSENPMARFASWDSVLEALHGLENIKPAAAAGADAGKKITIKRPISATAGKVSKSVKNEGPAASAASRLPAEPGEATGNSIDAARKAAQIRARNEELHSSGAGAKLFAFVALILVLGAIFVLRIGMLELDDLVAKHENGVRQAGSVEPVIAADDAQSEQPRPAPQARLDPAPEVASSLADSPARPAVRPEPQPDYAEPAFQEDDGEEALDRYLAAHVGEQVPFLYKGTEHSVTLVSYTATTVTIRTRKALTLNRSDLTAEQLELWK